jgi:hypothetical protein
VIKNYPFFLFYWPIVFPNFLILFIGVDWKFSSQFYYFSSHIKTAVNPTKLWYIKNTTKLIQETFQLFHLLWHPEDWCKISLKNENIFHFLNFSWTQKKIRKRNSKVNLIKYFFCFGRKIYSQKKNEGSRAWDHFEAYTLMFREKTRK